MKEILKVVTIISIILIVTSCNEHLPARYDLRTKKRAPQMDLQKWGTCWAFSTIASLESNLKTTGSTDTTKLSPYHMDKYSGFTRKGHKSHVNNTYYSGEGERFPGSNSDDNNSGLIVHLGGDFKMATAYLTNQGGATIRKINPTDNRSFFGETFDEGIRPEGSKGRYMPSHVEWLSMYSQSENDIKSHIKKSIIKYGAISTSQLMNYKPLGVYTDGLEVHYEQDGNKKINHAINIIGWDDNFYYKDLKGAWLVQDSDHKNEETGEQVGHFWIPYDDKLIIKDPDMGAVRFREVEKRNFNQIYSHSLHGWQYTTLPNSDIKSVINRYQIIDSEKISGVGIYTTAKQVNVTTNIYLNNLNNKVSTSNDRYEFPGFHYISLDKEVKIKKGDIILIEQINSNNQYAYDASFTMDLLLNSTLPKEGDPINVNSKANKNESLYINTQDIITEFNNYIKVKDISVKNKHAKQSDTANFAINLYTLK